MNIENSEYITRESLLKSVIEEVITSQFINAESRIFAEDRTLDDIRVGLRSRFPNDEARQLDELSYEVSRGLCRQASIDTYKTLQDSNYFKGNNYGFLITNKAWDLSDWNKAFVNPTWFEHTVLMLNIGNYWYAVSPANHISEGAKDHIERMVAKQCPEDIRYRFYGALEKASPRNIFKGNTTAQVMSEISETHLGVWPTEKEICDFTAKQMQQQLGNGQIPEMIYKP